MLKVLINQSNTVVNFIRLAADSVWTPPENHQVVDWVDGVLEGDHWDGDVFIHQTVPPVVPTKEQLKSKVSKLFESKWQSPIAFSVGVIS